VSTQLQLKINNSNNNVIPVLQVWNTKYKLSELAIKQILARNLSQHKCDGTRKVELVENFMHAEIRQSAKCSSEVQRKFCCRQGKPEGDAVAYGGTRRLQLGARVCIYTAGADISYAASSSH
jgi:hypothetical protein